MPLLGKRESCLPKDLGIFRQPSTEYVQAPPARSSLVKLRSNTPANQRGPIQACYDLKLPSQSGSRRNLSHSSRHCDRHTPPKMANPHPITKVYPEQPFHSKNAIKSGVNGALIGGAAGLIASAVQNSLAKTNVGAFGVFTRSGSTVATLSTCGRSCVLGGPC